jgi:hypothetical protein
MSVESKAQDSPGLQAVKTALQAKNRATRLSGVSLGDAEVVYLAKELAADRDIVSLELYHNKFGVEGCTALSNALKTNTALRALVRVFVLPVDMVESHCIARRCRARPQFGLVLVFRIRRHFPVRWATQSSRRCCRV